APRAQPATAGSTPLATYRQDILLRLRGGENPQQIAAYIAPRAGVTPATVISYIQSLPQRSPGLGQTLTCHSKTPPTARPPGPALLRAAGAPGPDMPHRSSAADR